ncbi:MAG: KH domain-containing protein [Sandaracinaceae bacterium]|nr:KH domain-containing protein [Sandaracinaceae bacterium]MDW8247448.1 KH domain-containing protein [Sandaracinaceae bacterium]
MSGEASSAEHAQVLEELVAYIAKALVDHPEAVKVESSLEKGRLKLRLAVAPEDLGKVIGKEGKTARAIRAVVAASAAQIGARAVLDIIE